jgi:hypothetical protein
MNQSYNKTDLCWDSCGATRFECVQCTEDMSSTGHTVSWRGNRKTITSGLGQKPCGEPPLLDEESTAVIKVQNNTSRRKYLLWFLIPVTCYFIKMSMMACFWHELTRNKYTYQSIIQSNTRIENSRNLMQST